MLEALRGVIFKIQPLKEPAPKKILPIVPDLIFLYENVGQPYV